MSTRGLIHQTAKCEMHADRIHGCSHRGCSSGDAVLPPSKPPEVCSVASTAGAQRAGGRKQGSKRPRCGAPEPAGDLPLCLGRAWWARWLWRIPLPHPPLLAEGPPLNTPMHGEHHGCSRRGCSSGDAAFPPSKPPGVFSVASTAGAQRAGGRTQGSRRPRRGAPEPLGGNIEMLRKAGRSRRQLQQRLPRRGDCHPRRPDEIYLLRPPAGFWV